MKQWVIRRSQSNAADAASNNRWYRRSNVDKTASTIRSKVYGPPPVPDAAAQDIEEILGPAPQAKRSKPKGSK